MTKQSILKGRGKPWSFAALNPQLFGSVMPVCKQPVATLALDSCPLASTAFGVFRYPFTCSYPKNPHIATMFAQMGFAEYLGTGIRKISDLCEIYSGLKPKFVDNDIFIAEIPLTDHVPEGEKSGGLKVPVNGTLSSTLNGTLIKNIKESLNASQSKVFDFIMRNPGCMGKEITGALDMPRDTFNKIIRSLFEKKIIERRGSKKTGGYWVKKTPTSTNW